MEEEEEKTFIRVFASSHGTDGTDPQNGNRVNHFLPRELEQIMRNNPRDSKRFFPPAFDAVGGRKISHIWLAR